MYGYPDSIGNIGLGLLSPMDGPFGNKTIALSTVDFLKNLRSSKNTKSAQGGLALYQPVSYKNRFPLGDGRGEKWIRALCYGMGISVFALCLLRK